MFATIYFDEDYKNVIKKVYDTKVDNKIILKCKYYMYPNIIFDNTPLPKVLVNLICKWIDDEIIFDISVCEHSSVLVHSNEACINFVDIHINFKIFVYADEKYGPKEFSRLYNILLSTNIINFELCKDKYDNYARTRKIFDIFLQKHKQKEKIEKTYELVCNKEPFTAEIVNIDLLLFIIDVLCIFNKVQLN